MVIAANGWNESLRYMGTLHQQHYKQVGAAHYSTIVLLYMVIIAKGLRDLDAWGPVLTALQTCTHPGPSLGTAP
jgi:hypothetical protein